MASIPGTNGNDSLAGSSSNDTITPLLGRDTVDGSGGTDTLIIDYSALSDNVSASNGSCSDGRYNSVSFYGVEKLNIASGLGDDHLSGMGAADTLAGGAGYDVLSGGGGSDNIDGGEGVDTWKDDYSSSAASISITLGNSKDESGNTNATISISGSTAPVVKNVEALSLYTGSGNDKVSVGKWAYDDEIRTGDGDDQIHVGMGGRDYVDGGAGVDLGTFDWSASKTNITVDAYWDDYADSEGRTVNFDSVERFNLIGGAGNDHLAGDIYNDTLIGGGGRDTLESARGADSLDGGGGVDVWSADYSSATGDIKVTLNNTGANEVIAGITGAMVINMERLSFSTGSGNDAVSSGPYAYDDKIYTNNGDDTINVGKGGTDYVHGGDGVDLGVFNWSASTSDITVDAYWDDYADAQGRSVNFDAVERFNLTGGGGDDHLAGDVYNDTLIGGGRSDTLEGGSGGDSIDGGEGVDLWSADYSASTVAIKIQLSADATANAVLAGIKGGTVKGIERLSMTTGSANDVVSTAAFAYNDKIYTNNGDDTLNVGKGGTDYVHGGDGVDLGIFDWSASTTAITVDAYWDDYADSEGRSVNFDAVERFDLTGGSAGDHLAGDSWNDTLRGGSGDDTLEGGGYRADVSMANVDLIDGGAGVDLWKADYSAFTQAIQIQLTSVVDKNEVLGGITDGETNGVVKNVERISIVSGSGDDTISCGTLAYDDNIQSGSGEDRIHVGTGGRDYVNGGAGIDVGQFDWSASTTSISGDSYWTDYSDHEGRYVNFDAVERFNLTGGLGNDALYGGSYSDTLIGGGGGDRLDGSGGDDTMTGGKGDDWFYVRSGGGVETITDFAAGGSADVVYFDYYRPFDTMDFATIRSNMEQSGSDVVLTLSDVDAIRFLNTTVGTFTASDFIWS